MFCRRLTEFRNNEHDILDHTLLWNSVTLPGVDFPNSPTCSCAKHTVVHAHHADRPPRCRRRRKSSAICSRAYCLASFCSREDPLSETQAVLYQWRLMPLTTSGHVTSMYLNVDTADSRLRLDAASCVFYASCTNALQVAGGSTLTFNLKVPTVISNTLHFSFCCSHLCHERHVPLIDEQFALQPFNIFPFPFHSLSSDTILPQQHIMCGSFSSYRDAIVRKGDNGGERQNVRAALISRKQVWAETGCSSETLEDGPSVFHSLRCCWQMQALMTSPP